MNYKEYLIQNRTEKILKAYEQLPKHVRCYTMPDMVTTHSRLTQEGDPAFEYLSFIKPLNDLVMMGAIDFDIKLSLEEIVKQIKS